MSDLNIRTIVEALTKPEVQRPHTRIEDLSDVGYKLSEEHLQLVTGGMKPRCWVLSCSGGQCEADHD